MIDRLTCPSDANFHLWNSTSVKYLGGKALGNQHQSREGDEGCPPMYECSESVGEEVVCLGIGRALILITVNLGGTPLEGFGTSCMNS